MRVSWIACLALVFIVLCLGPQPGRAEDEEGLTMRLLPVGALTRGRPYFLREAPPIVGADDVSDENRPLFGGEGEEAILPVGTIDELLDLVKRRAEPSFWETREGADIRAMGEHVLVVRATPAVHATVAKTLAQLERVHCGTIVVDVACARQPALAVRALLQGRGGLALSNEQVRSLLGDASAGPAVTLAAFEGQRAASFAGRMLPYVQDHDVEVAENSSTSDPIVGVANAGLAASVLCTVNDDDGTVLIGLDAFLAEHANTRTAPTINNGPMQVPAFDVTHARAVVRVTPGAWVVADGKASPKGIGSWLFLLRARITPAASSDRSPAGVDLGSPVPAGRGPSQFRAFDVPHLGAPVRHLVGPDVVVRPSNFTPPEPPETPEPSAAVSSDQLVGLLVGALGADAWEEPASIQCREGRLYVRNRPNVLDAVATRLGELRRGFLWNLVTTADVIDVPETLARDFLEVETGAAGTAPVVLDRSKTETLERALEKGEARLLDSVRVTNFHGVRNVGRSGQEIAYVSDYEVEIAQGTNIGNPVVQSAFAGAQLDLAADLSLDRTSLHLDVRFVRSDLATPPPTFTTQHGDIELPEMKLIRLRTSLRAPVGRTVVAGSWKAEDRRVLLLLTPHLR